MVALEATQAEEAREEEEAPEVAAARTAAVDTARIWDAGQRGAAFRQGRVALLFGQRRESRSLTPIREKRDWVRDATMGGAALEIAEPFFAGASLANAWGMLRQPASAILELNPR